MKKINKLFLAAGSVAAIATPIAAVVSCGSQSKETSLPLAQYVDNVTWNDDVTAKATNASQPNVASRIMAFTDGGNKNDKSFNQQTWEAVSSFKSAAADDSAQNDDVIKSAASSSSSDLLRTYRSATSAKTFVMSGFLHSAPLAAFSGEQADKAFVFVDGNIDAPYDKFATDASSTDHLSASASATADFTDFVIEPATSILKVETWSTPAAGAEKQLVEIKGAENIKFDAATHKLSVKTSEIKNDNLKVSITRRQSNIANLNFKSEQAGFLAGVAAATYSKKLHNDEVRIATFGGMAIPSVTSFMNGFVAGAKHVADAASAKLMVNGLEYSAFTSANKSAYFVNDFTADKDGRVSSLATDLLKKGADVIFPVGGPQEFTVLNVIKANKSNARVVGVDTDMVDLMTGNADSDKQYVLTSATKYIKQAITQTLDALYGSQSAPAPAVKVVTETGKAVLGKDYLGGLANNWVGVGKFGSTTTTDEQAAVEAIKNIGSGTQNAWDATDETAINAKVVNLF